MGNRLVLRAAFYIDVGPEVGLGHLRRSQAVANELTRLGVAVDLLLDARQSSAIPGTADYRGYRFSPDFWVLDALSVPAEVLERLRTARSRVSLCPVLDIPDIDIVFHRGYCDEVPASISRKFCGLEWCILGPSTRAPRNEQAFARCLAAKPWKIGICLGGGKQEQLLDDVLDGFRLHPSTPYMLKVLLSPHTRQRKPVPFVEFVRLGLEEEPWAHFDDCVLLITRSGLTPYEAAHLGWPSVIVTGGLGFGRILFDKELAFPCERGHLARNSVDSLQTCKEVVRTAFLTGRQSVNATGSARVAATILEEVGPKE